VKSYASEGRDQQRIRSTVQQREAENAGLG